MATNRSGGSAGGGRAGGRAGRPGGGGTGGAGGRGAGGGRPSSGRSSGPRPVGGGKGGGRQGVGGGAGRTGAVRRGAGTSMSNRPAPEKTLGGYQVEGRQAVRELLIAGTRKVHEVWIAAEMDDGGSVSDIVELARSMRVPIQEVSRKRLDMEARSEAPQGVLAKAAALPEVEFDQFLKRKPGKAPFLVAVDGVTDPGNLGAIIRSADGAGVTGLVLPRHRAVHVTPTVAKASAGAIEHVPMSVVPGIPTALARMKEAGIWVVGLDDGGDRNLFELGDLAAEGICLVLGAEGSGLSRLVRERCDLIVHIPMRGRLSSLNVSAAAALAVYEVARHR